MKMQTRVTRRIIAGILGAALLPLSSISVLAHEAPCPLCGMTITQDTPTQDNEVALKIGRKRIEYKCVYCALAEARTEYKGDLSISAPSEKKGEPVVLKREGETWTALPEAPYFVSPAKLKHKICQQQARAFTTLEAAQKYLQENKDAVGDAKPLTLAEMLQVAGIAPNASSDSAPADKAPVEKAPADKAPDADHGEHEGHGEHAGHDQ